MKSTAFALLTVSALTLHAQLLDTASLPKVSLPSVELLEVRASERTPMTAKTITITSIDERSFSKSYLSNMNTGQDIPYVLQFLPSMTQSSDAGTGMGYTYLRMRGMDQTRINVTINGAPVNDPESHGVFWVNTPDLTTSLNSVQIQRGVGTSTVGAGAFGGSISMEVGVPNQKASTQLTLGAGYFGSSRASVVMHSGAVGFKGQKDKPFTFMGRYSSLQSAGFIDRSAVDLTSYLISGQARFKDGYVRLVHFSGEERTQQAWWGIPEAKYRGDAQGVEDYIARNYLDSADADNLRRSGNRTYNYYRYPNEIDQYRQAHTQFITKVYLPRNWDLNITTYFVSGKGYFEQYRAGDAFADYGLENPVINGDTVYTTDLIRQRWLDNFMIGTNASLVKQVGDRKYVLGGFWNGYLGDHFGTLPWMRINPLPSIGTTYNFWLDREDFQGANEYRYYEAVGDKMDVTGYAKAEIPFGPFLAYGDLQVRNVAYYIYGLGDDQARLDLGYNQLFFNPKAGLDWQHVADNNAIHRVYLSGAIANREPNRNDFVDRRDLEAPKAESLFDLETGYILAGPTYRLEATGYAMEYKNQLVPTGALNDVGALLRTNVDRSFRRGIELAAESRMGQHWSLFANATFSTNRIAAFEEVLYDYLDYSEVKTLYTNTPIAFSPAFMGNAILKYVWITDAMDPQEPQAYVALRAKTVGRQFLDNTGQQSRSLDPYQTFDLQFSLPATWGTVKVDFLNVLNAQYAPNGYTWGYLYGGQRTDENFYYPMAGRMVMLTYTLGLEG